MGHNAGVQFCVRREDGAWHYFIGPRREEGKLCKQAESFSRDLLEFIERRSAMEERYNRHLEKGN